MDSRISGLAGACPCPRWKGRLLTFFGQFEQSLRTSGSWNTTIEVFVTDNEFSVHASASPGSSSIVEYQGKEFIAPNAWQQIVQGVEDPSGPIQADGSGRDIVVNWNMFLSQPQSNIGLLRHELLHGLGMLSYLPAPRINFQGTILKPGVGPGNAASVRGSRRNSRVIRRTHDS